jgi:hypothetical protein
VICKELASYILNSYHGAMLRGKLTGDRTPYDQFLNFTFGLPFEACEDLM